jgi:hypothetical protein
MEGRDDLMGERRTAIYTVETEGRDKGKRFLLTEMSASKAESWAYRVILALANSNTQMPEGFEQTGMAGLAQLGLRGLIGLPWFVAEPLLKEMFECVQILPDPKNPKFARDLEPAGGDGDYDIEEVTTRMNLRMEIFKLHVDFSKAGVQSLLDRAKGMAGRASHTATESQK